MTDCRGSHFSVGGVARGFLDKHVFVHCVCLANYILGVDSHSQVLCVDFQIQRELFLGGFQSRHCVYI